MELPTDVEEIVSDDYEEGEILEEDNLYDDISSMEEFSSEEPEDKKDPLVVDLTGDVTFINLKRRKEHKCKEGSVCRKERKAKHCYARIRKEKHVWTSIPDEIVESHSVPCSDKNRPRKLECDSTDSRNIDRYRDINYSRVRTDHTKTYDDTKVSEYREKENRILNKRHWSSNEKSSRSRSKYPPKYSRRSRSREYKPKHANSSVSTPLRHSGKVETNKNTSLLKRLVGSGTAGVKTIKDGDSNSNVSGHSDVSEVTAPMATPHCPQPHKSTTQPTVGTSLLSAESSNSTLLETPTEAQDPPPEQKKKGFGLVWKRSIKDDNDELHLRVEALKSAWIKKLSDRKKRGLLNQKKSYINNDSFFDFDLTSDTEEGGKVSEPEDKSKTSDSRSVVDQSGDSLKSECLENVSTSQVPLEEPGLSEPSQGNAAPFVRDSSESIPFSPTAEENVKRAGTPVKPTSDPSNYKVPNTQNKETNPCKAQPVVDRSSSRKKKDRLRHRRNMKRPRRRQKARSSLKKSASNDLDDEMVLRERALMTLNSKSKPSNTSDELKVGSTIGATGTSITTANKSASNNQRSLVVSSNKPLDKKLTAACESEGHGATSSDNWEDEIDEDILRAKLLSSLTKQVTNKKTENVIESAMKPHDVGNPLSKKRSKIINKKVWKNNDVTSETKINEDSRPLLQHYHKLTDKGPSVVEQYHKAAEKKGPTAVQPSNIPQIPQVPRMVITLDDSDSSTDLDIVTDGGEENEADEGLVSSSVTTQMEANIERLLLEAQKNSQIEKSSNDSTIHPGEANMKSSFSTEESSEEKPIVRSNTVSQVSNSSHQSTPQALKHLPAWQQEEYRRLKLKIAEKEKVLQEVSRAKSLEIDDVRRGKDSQSEHSKGPSQTKDPGGAGTSKAPEGSSQVRIGKATGVTRSVSSQNCVSSTQKLKSSSDHLQSNQASHSSDDTCSANKKAYTDIASCSVVEEINVLSDIVNDFEKNSTEYSELRRKKEHLEKVLKQIDTKINGKKRKLLLIKDTIQEKDRNISSRIASLTISQKIPADNKSASRDMELINFKYKELSLKAKFLFHSFSTVSVSSTKPNERSLQSKNMSKESVLGAGVKRPGEKISLSTFKKAHSDAALIEKEKDVTEQQVKRTFSVKERERGDWDPNTPVCHFDLNGICKDQECKYQHFKTV